MLETLCEDEGRVTYVIVNGLGFTSAPFEQAIYLQVNLSAQKFVVELFSKSNMAHDTFGVTLIFDLPLTSRMSFKCVHFNGRHIFPICVSR